MIPSLKIRHVTNNLDIKTEISDIAKKYFESSHRQVLPNKYMLIGKHGIGKTYIAQSLVKELGNKYGENSIRVCDNENDILNNLPHREDCFYIATALDKQFAYDRHWIFDRFYYLDMPSISERESIIRTCTHTDNIREVAKLTFNFTPTDLIQLVKESNILKGDINLALKNFHCVSEKNKKIIACHEAGHVILALKNGEYEKHNVVSIFGTDWLADSFIYSRKQLEDTICLILAGKAAEDFVYGNYAVTTHDIDDVKIAEQHARTMIMQYGFSDKYSMMYFNKNMMSNALAYMLDKEVMAVLKNAYIKTKNIIEKNFEPLNIIAETLYHHEKINSEELLDILKENKLKIR